MSEILKGQILQSEKRPRLERCPFCGEEAEIVARGVMHYDQQFFPRCTVSSCLGRNTTKGYVSPQAAAKAWNRRQEANRSSCVNCAVYKQQKWEKK